MTVPIFKKGSACQCLKRGNESGEEKTRERIYKIHLFSKNGTLCFRTAVHIEFLYILDISDGKYGYDELSEYQTCRSRMDRLK